MPTRFTPKLRRTMQTRRQLWRNQVTSLFKHERIKTTFAKARALRRVADKMISYAKRGTVHDYKQAASFIQEPAMLRKCFTELASRYKFRPGGYTRVVRTFNRRVDHAPMAYIELIGRAGEFRAAKQVNYLTAVEKGLVPPPLAPIVTPRDLKIASAISPSTSNRVQLHRPFWRRTQQDHLYYYPDFTRMTTLLKLPIFFRRYKRHLRNAAEFEQKAYKKYGKEAVQQHRSEQLKAVVQQTSAGLV